MFHHADSVIICMFFSTFVVKRYHLTAAGAFVCSYLKRPSSGFPDWFFSARENPSWIRICNRKIPCWILPPILPPHASRRANILVLLREVVQLVTVHPRWLFRAILIPLASLLCLFSATGSFNCWHIHLSNQCIPCCIQFHRLAN